MSVPKQHSLNLVGGRFNPASAGAALDDLFRAVTDPPRKNLVVYFHGGLVSQEKALASAEVLGPQLADANTCPVFFVWNSDILTTLTNKLSTVAETAGFKDLFRRTAQLAAGLYTANAGTRSVGKFTVPSMMAEVPSELDELQTYLDAVDAKAEANPVAELTDEQEEQVSQAFATDADLLNALDEESDLLSKKARGELTQRHGGTGTRGIFTLSAGALGWKGAKCFGRIVYRRYHRRHHSLYDTVAQELLRSFYFDTVGGTVWSEMKNNARAAFGGAECGGTAFLAKLKAHWQPGQRVTLVGHSAGAIFTGHFLSAADELLPEEMKFDLVWLAPACTFQFLADHLKVFDRRVRGFRLFALPDDRERGHTDVKLLSRSSLLYFVAGLLEKETDTPLVGMQRYHSGEAPYDELPMRESLKFLKDKTVWAGANGKDGWQCGATQHGGFAEDPLTLASLQHILREGL